MNTIERRVDARPSLDNLLASSKSVLGRFIGPVSLAVLIILWEGLVRLTRISPVLLPSPSAIGQQFIEVSQKGLLWGPLWESMQALAVGLVLSILVGVPVGILLGGVHVLDLISTPYLYALYAMPRIALAPLMAIWVGLGFQAKVWMILVCSGITVLLIVAEGVKTIDESLIRVAHSFGASRLNTYIKVAVPNMIPSIANAISNGVGIGIVGLLIIEMFSTSGGIGGEVVRAHRQYNSPRMYAFVIVLIAISLALIALCRRLEVYASRWREEAYV